VKHLSGFFPTQNFIITREATFSCTSDARLAIRGMKSPDGDIKFIVQVVAPSREQPPLYQKLSWPTRFSERHYSGKRFAVNFSQGGGCPVLFAKHPFRLQRSGESSGHSQTAPTKLLSKVGDFQCLPFFRVGTYSCAFLQPPFLIC